MSVSKEGGIVYHKRCYTEYERPLATFVQVSESQMLIPRFLHLVLPSREFSSKRLFLLVPIFIGTSKGHSIRYKDFGADRLRFKSQFYHLLVVRPWGNFFTSVLLVKL